jgi:hypothetical protein
MKFMERKSSKVENVGDIQDAVSRSLDKLAELDRSGELPEALRGLLYIAPPDHHRSSVAMKYPAAKGWRQRRRDADASYWHRETDAIEVTFQALPMVPVGVRSPLVDREVAYEPRAAAVDARVASLIRALAKAERDPRFSQFVALKRFRDDYLLTEGQEWAYSPDGRHDVLRAAIESGFVLRSQVANPKSPSFPVTAVHVNREHPVVIQVLRESNMPNSRFAPITLAGEPLSATIVRERG